MVYPPSLISRKFARRGVTVPVLVVRRDSDTPSHHTMQARARTGADGMKRESRLQSVPVLVVLVDAGDLFAL